MNSEPLEPETVRSLGSAIATHDHESLPTHRFEELAEFSTGVDSALETDNTVAAAEALLAFWTGYVGTQAGVTLEDRDPATLFEEGFEAETIGVDLYQALVKLDGALQADDGRPTLSGWTDRLFELTNRHVAHLEGHQESG